MTPDVLLRPIERADLEAYFAHQADPESTAMAGVVARDREQFDAHWAWILNNLEVLTRTIVADGKVAGNIGSWPADDRQLVGYILGREFWGCGIATRALRLFLDEVPHRPLHAYAAVHNTGSIRVLEKCGFRRDLSAPVEEPDDGIEEHLFVLAGRHRPPE